jgi:hypothetical protein
LVETKDTSADRYVDGETRRPLPAGFLLSRSYMFSPLLPVVAARSTAARWRRGPCRPSLCRSGNGGSTYPVGQRCTCRSTAWALIARADDCAWSQACRRSNHNSILSASCDTGSGTPGRDMVPVSPPHILAQDVESTSGPQPGRSNRSNRRADFSGRVTQPMRDFVTANEGFRHSP